MTIHTKLADIAKQRSAACDRINALAAMESLTDAEQTEFNTKAKEVKAFDEQTIRIKAAQELSAATAQPVAGQERAVPASAETDRYVKEKSLVIGGVVKMLGMGGGNIYNARVASKDAYGENHPVTKALAVSTGPAGGFIVPPDYMAEIIELLRPQAVVRGSNPRIIPMPRGTMTLPGQASAATASYGSEGTTANASQPGLKSITASFKKLTAKVPVSNDMMRHADPAVDAFVRDDLVKVLGLTEDRAFLLGDGTQDTPMGYLGFANRWVSLNTGTVGVWSSAANSVLAVNGADPSGSTGGNFITSNATFTLSTVAGELATAVNKLDTANVPEARRMWFFHPRTYNYLFNVQNSLGLYVYRDEMSKGTLLSYPFKKTTQIPANIWDAAGSNKDLSFVFLVEMTESIILDSMQLELSVFREGSYTDSSGTVVSALDTDQTVLRAIAEHDFQMRHDQAVAIIQGVRWAPAGS